MASFYRVRVNNKKIENCKIKEMNTYNTPVHKHRQNKRKHLNLTTESKRNGAVLAVSHLCLRLSGAVVSAANTI